MAATPISQASRYITPGVTKIYYCATIANKAAPTRSELNAGTELMREVNSLEGWVIESNNVETPDGDSTFTGTIPGRTSAADSSITFYADETGSDARSLLPRLATGYIVFLDGGDVPTRSMDVFPIRVSSVGKVRSIEGSEAATVIINFAITSVPAEDVDVPA